jgi:prepilin-type N-terminal cleavage/methylation domain-containing protein
MNIFKFKSRILQTFCHCPARVLTGQENNRCQKLFTPLTFSKSLCGSRTRGFTLVELLVVLSIISFLSSVILAGTRTARNKAIDAKIAEDLRQVKTAADIYYAGKQSYIFSISDNSDKNIFAGDENTLSVGSFNPFSIKTANAQSVPQSCVVFNNVAGNLVAAKYLAAMPIHPRQDYSKGICYKAATSTDGSYFAAYGQLSSSISISGASTPKNVGFISGDTSVATLQAIYAATSNQFPATAIANTPPTSIASIVDQVQGITSGVAGSYGESSGYTEIHTLNTSVTPSGAGIIYGSVNDPSCPITTPQLATQTYSDPTAVVFLKAVPAIGYTSPPTWSGCGALSEAPYYCCAVTMREDITVNATFSGLTYTLTSFAQSPNGGTGNISGNLSPYTNGSTATLVATPANGSTFVSWSGCTSTNGTTCYVSMTSNKTVTAVFNLSEV